MRFPNEGSLDKINLAAFLADLALTKATGTLRMESSEGAIKVLYFKEGLFAYASSNEEADRLGNVLIREGKLTKEQLDLATSKLEGNKTLGKQLIEMGFITPEELLWAAKKQVEGIVVSVFGWNKGNYEWVKGDLPDGLVNLKLPSENLILAGVTAIANRDAVLKYIGGHNAIYNFTPAFMDTYAKLTLPETIDPLIAGIDGARPVSDVSKLCKDGEFKAYQFLYFAKAYNLIEEIKKSPEADIPTAKQIEIPPPPKPAPAPKPAPSLKATPPTIPPTTLPPVPKPATPFFPKAEPFSPKFADAHKHEPPKPGISHLKPAPPPEPPTPQFNLPSLSGFLKDEAQSTPLDLTIGEDAKESSVAEAPKQALFNKELAAERPAGGAAKKFLVVLIVIIALAGAALGVKYWVGENAPQWLDIAYFLGKKEEILKPTAEISQEEETQTIIIEEIPPLPEEPETKKEEPPIVLKEETPIQITEPAPAKEEVKKIEKIEEAKPAPPKEKPKSVLQVPQDGEARELLAKGRYLESARVWQKGIKTLPSSTYTIQLELVCQEKSVERAVAEAGGNSSLMIVPTLFQGKACYKVLWGVYDTKKSADESLSKLPPFFRDMKPRPQITTVGAVR